MVILQLFYNIRCQQFIYRFEELIYLFLVMTESGKISCRLRGLCRLSIIIVHGIRCKFIFILDYVY